MSLKVLLRENHEKLVLRRLWQVIVLFLAEQKPRI